ALHWQVLPAQLSAACPACIESTGSQARPAFRRLAGVVAALCCRARRKGKRRTQQCCFGPKFQASGLRIATLPMEAVLQLQSLAQELVSEGADAGHFVRSG
ncbi:unnamed protein product, partial [Polarella glacialis]